MKGIQNKSRLINYLGEIGCVGLLLLMTVLLLPVRPEIAEAAMNAEVSGEVTANIKSALAISLNDALTFDIAPLAGGNFAADATQVHIATNNVSGYKVYVTASNDGKLVSVDKTQTSAINPVNGMMTVSNYKDNLNTWGYTTQVGEMAEYQALPLTAETPVFESEEQASDDTYELGFAVAVDTDLPSGTYQGAVIVSAVANPMAVTNLTQLTYMQDMTTEICQNTMDYVDVNNYVTKQLIDTRDGKSYWVAKLADGNCWMTEDLKLSLSTAKALTPNDSDVTSNWAPSRDTATSASSGLNWNTDFSWIFNDIWYYEWTAATAGGKTTESICPKGWKLPDGTSGPINGGFEKLLTEYNAFGEGEAVVSSIMSEPLNFRITGIVDGTGVTQTSTGYYWTRNLAPSNSQSACSLTFRDGGNGSSVSCQTGRYWGCAMRCVAVGE